MKSYKTISINGKQKRLHRYIMECSIGRDLEPTELVHHKDGNIYNNDLSNLELVTRSEHIKKHPVIGKTSRFKKKYIINKKDILDLYKIKSIREISEIYNCSQGCIQAIIGKNKKNKVFCRICGEEANYRKVELCSKHYLQRRYENAKQFY